MAILSLLSATLGMINIMAAASTTSVPYNIIKADICTESGCSAPYPTSGELATYGSSSIASIAAGPPRTITAQGQYVDCSGKPQSWDGTYHHTSFCLSWNTITSGKPARSGIADTVTITETTVAQGSQNGVPYGVLTSILSAATTPSNAPITSSAFSSVTTTGYSQITSSATPTPFTPDTSDTSLQQCLHNPGGLQADGHVSPGCGNMLQHIMDCYDQQAPWTDPYNGTQSTGFQSCLCQTDSHTTFSPTSALWRNFTGCSHCLLTFVPVSFHRLSIEIQRIENFCCSQNPVAYLFLLRLQGWLGGLHDGTHLEQPPLTGEITNIGALGAKFTIMLPLANVAYGASAPSDGSLAAVTPSLTTLSVTPGMSQSETQLVTSFVTWVPTAIPNSDFDLDAAAKSAAAVASTELKGALNSIAADAGGEDGASADCIRACPSAASAVTYSSLLLAGLGAVAVGMLLTV